MLGEITLQIQDLRADLLDEIEAYLPSEHTYVDLHLGCVGAVSPAGIKYMDGSRIYSYEARVGQTEFNDVTELPVELLLELVRQLKHQYRLKDLEGKCPQRQNFRLS